MEKIKYHKTLASYFESKPLYLDEPTQKKPDTRKLVEQPWQQTKAEMWDEVTETLCNLDFIRAKFMARMHNDLIADYNRLEINYIDPPIITPSFSRYHLCILCPFCLSQSKISESNLGSDFQCPDCKNKLKINQFYIHRYCSSSPTLKNFITRSNSSLFDYSKCLIDCAKFVLNQIQVLSRFPDLTLQQAANRSHASTLPLLASQKLAEKSIKQHWFSFSNRPEEENPNILTLVGHKAAVKCCAYSPDGCFLVSGSSDGMLKIWNSHNGIEVNSFTDYYSGITSCEFSRDGQQLVIGYQDGCLRVLGFPSGNQIALLVSASESIVSCYFSSNEKHLISCDSKSVIRTWCCDDFKLVNHTPYYKNLAKLTPLSYNRILMVLQGGNVAIWDAKKSIELCRFDVETSDIFRTIWSSCVSPSETEIALSIGEPREEIIYKSKKINVFDIVTGKQIDMLMWNGRYALNIKYSPDAMFIAFTYGGVYSTQHQIAIWSRNTPKVLTKFFGHNDTINSLIFSPDGKRITSASDDCSIKIWDMTACFQDNPQTKSSLINQDCKWQGRERFNCLAVSPDGTFIAVGTGLFKDGRIYLFSTATGDSLNSYSAYDCGVSACSWAPTSKYLATAALNGAITLRNSTTGEILSSPWYDKKIELGSICHSPSGKYLLACYLGGLLWLSLYSLESGTEFRSIHEDLLPFRHRRHFESSWKCNITCSFSPDGRLILATGLDGRLELVDACKMVKIASSQSLLEDAQIGAFSPDGRYVAAVYSENRIKIKNLRNEIICSEFHGHSANVTHCVWVQSGDKILSCAEDKCLILWDVKTGTELCKFVLFDNPSGLLWCQRTKSAIVIDYTGFFYSLEVMSADIEIPIVTPVRMFILDTRQWDLTYSVTCPWCGKKIHVLDKIIHFIIGLNSESNLLSSDPRNLNVTDEDWEAGELMSNCFYCEKQLRYNPFLVDES